MRRLESILFYFHFLFSLVGKNDSTLARSRRALDCTCTELREINSFQKTCTVLGFTELWGYTTFKHKQSAWIFTCNFYENDWRRMELAKEKKKWSERKGQRITPSNNHRKRTWGGERRRWKSILVGRSTTMIQSITVHLLLFTATALHGERDPVHDCILVLNDIGSKRGGK